MSVKSMGRHSGLILDRRALMKSAAALGLGFGAMSVVGSAAWAQEAPGKGGTLRLGMEGGSASDSLDPRTYTDPIPITYGYMIWNGLIEIGPDGRPAGELLESWEARPGAREWIFNVRKGVTFHSGKTLDADDVIYSINLHRGDTKSGAKEFLKSIRDIRKLAPYQIRIELSEGNLDLLYNLADYHVLCVPDGFTDFSKPDGTGAYRLVSFQPGVRVVTRNSGNYWKSGRGNFDSVELHYIPDAGSRLQALMAGQVDVVNRLDPKTVDIVASSEEINIVRSRGTGSRFTFVALCDTDPYSSPDLRLALKYGIDRQKIVDIVYQGYAILGNDTTISPTNKNYAGNIPQRAYDPDKAAFHYRKAGSPKLELKVSETAYSGATDAGLLYQEALRQAGIDLTITRVSGDGYWSSVWLKEPFSATYWGGRLNADQALSQTFLSSANWNDTHWRRPEFDRLVLDARVEADEARRHELYEQAQKLIHDDGGMICYAIGDYLDGYSSRIKGAAPHPRYDMCDLRIAEKGWFA